MDAVVNLCDRHAQEKDVTVKSDTQGIPWYNENTYALIAEKKNRALVYDRRKGNRKTKTTLRQITHKLRNLKRRQKRAYFQE